MFKEKSTKKRLPVSQSAKDCSTLDAQHQSFIQNLQIQHQKLASFTEQKAKFQLQNEYWLKRIQEIDDYESDAYNEAWVSNVFYKDQMKQLDQQIARLESCQDEIDYYESTANILFQYYDLLEHQNTKNAPTSTISIVPTRATKGKKKLLPVSSRSILDALSGPSENTNDKEKESAIVTEGLDKTTLVDEYLAAVHPDHIPKQCTDSIGMCTQCDVPLICLQQDGVMVCGECGYQELLLVEQNRPILRQPTKETSHFSYKRINHFNFGVKQQAFKACHLLVASCA